MLVNADDLLFLLVNNMLKQINSSVYFSRDLTIEKSMLLGLLVICLLCSLPSAAIAGIDAGLKAYNRQDYATALKELKPLAAQGNAIAQYKLGAMYANGWGVKQDDMRAVNMAMLKRKLVWGSTTTLALVCR